MEFSMREENYKSSFNEYFLKITKILFFIGDCFHFELENVRGCIMNIKNRYLKMLSSLTTEYNILFNCCKIWFRKFLYNFFSSLVVHVHVEMHYERINGN